VFNWKWTLASAIGRVSVGSPVRGTSVLCVVAAAFLVWPAAAAASDNFSSATPLPLNGTLGGQNTFSATEEADENRHCHSGDTHMNYSETMWYRLALPDRGMVTLSVDSDFDPVMALYGSGGKTSPYLACNDDSETLDPRIGPINLSAGTYYVQVGGVDSNGDGVGQDGSFSVTNTFDDLDNDNDGSFRPEDCNDGNAGIRPGANDVPHNNVDEDCVGGDDKDADNDGHAPPADCNDGNSSVRPGAAEIRGDFVDQNCDGRTPAALMKPFPTVLFPGLAYRTRTVFKALTIKSVERGNRVLVRCRGRGCPTRSLRVRVKASGTLRPRKFRTFALRPRAVLRVFVMAPATNELGKYVKFRVRAGRPPRRTDSCVAPGRFAVRSCNAG
jgi:hypothetical protein